MMEAAAIAAPNTGSLSRLIAFPRLPRRLLLVDAASGLRSGETSWVPSLFGGANCGCLQFSSDGEGHHARTGPGWESLIQADRGGRDVASVGEPAVEQGPGCARA